MRISKEIVSFVSGKEQRYAWDRAKVSDALSEEQRETAYAGWKKAVKRSRGWVEEK